MTQIKDPLPLEYMRSQVRPGDTVYTVLRHVTKSGMTRWIDACIMVNNEPVYISGYVAKIIDATTSREHGGVKMPGVGMDMGFALVYEFSARLFPEGFDIPQGSYGRNGMEDHDPDGGYALKHRWL